jgi:hypothetical protein
MIIKLLRSDGSYEKILIMHFPVYPDTDNC